MHRFRWFVRKEMQIFLKTNSKIMLRWSTTLKYYFGVGRWVAYGLHLTSITSGVGIRENVLKWSKGGCFFGAGGWGCIFWFLVDNSAWFRGVAVVCSFLWAPVCFFPCTVAPIFYGCTVFMSFALLVLA